MLQTIRTVALAVTALGLATGCPDKSDAAKDGPEIGDHDDENADAPSGSAPAAAAGPTSLPGLDRAAFNRRAAERALPLFWRADDNNNGALDVGELAVTTLPLAGTLSEWVQGTAFTPALVAAHKLLQKDTLDGATLTVTEKARREAVLAELAQGRSTLLENDFSGQSAADKAIVTHVLNAARLVEELYARQSGAYGLEKDIPADDTASKMMFARNQGPFCEAPKTEKDPICGALSQKPEKLSGLYPANIQKEGFCTVLEKRKDADALMHHFFVVAHQEGGQAAGDAATDALVAVPYHKAFAAQMTQVSDELKKAAAAIEGDKEAAFKAYLLAAAQAFLDDSWPTADEAWAKMNAENSAWYLRIGPDETYSDACSRKAGFHTSFARINQDSLAWQKKLDPHKTAMEEALAALAGPPYKARAVSFHLPDFIDIIVNAGDSRSAHGATIGQSLPNWGPVANEGRGRTVAMTNLYTDKDSAQAWQAQASSLLCKATMDKARFDPKQSVMSTVLHEAAHNLGPAHEYKVGGKTDDQAFGGPLASTLEELKAQTAALYFSEWLVEKGVIEPAQAEAAHLGDVTWAFGHIAQGMTTGDGKPKPYSQLASIQMGTLFQQGVLVWREDQDAANGSDKGCFDVELSKWKPAVDTLAKTVLQIKGKGDKAGALKLKAALVDKDDAWAKLRGTIAERWLRAPKASFVYGVKL